MPVPVPVPGRWVAALLAATLSFASPFAHADSADDAYETLVNAGPPHVLRTALEESLAIAGGTIWYWIDDRNIADWDNPSLEQRLTGEAWRFDRNTFPINWVWHTLTGATFHVVARDNDIGLLGSIGWGFATSFIWEYALEFKEKVSINDIVATTGSGIVVGEFSHWLGRYLESAPSRHGWHDVARWTLTPIRSVHNAMDGERPPRAGTTPDSLGLSSDIWHRFRGSLGVARADGVTLAGAEAAGEIVALPGYLAPGRERLFFAQGNVTSLRMRAAFGDGATSFDLQSDAVLLGLWDQNVPDAGLGRASIVGLGMAYDYRWQMLDAWKDRLGLIHLPGIALENTLLFEGIRLRTSARLWPDFAGLHAAAWPRWNRENPAEIEKTILQRRGYYYGWGWSGRLRLELAISRVAVGCAVFYGSYDSQEGLDRSQERMTVDVEAEDEVLDAETFFRVYPFGGRLYLEARLAHQGRESRVGDEREVLGLGTYGAAVGGEL